MSLQGLIGVVGPHAQSVGHVSQDSSIEQILSPHDSVIASVSNGKELSFMNHMFLFPVLSDRKNIQ